MRNDAFHETNDDYARGDCAMTNKTQISVCMATFNGERYIKDQLKSILIQLRSTDEVIIVDDASKDKTRQIISELRDERIHLISQEVNRGVLATFEEAIRRASGEIIFLSDQDDLWAANKVKEFVNAFQSHPEAEVAICDAALIDDRAAVIAPSIFAGRRFRPGLLANLFRTRYIGCLMALRSSLLPRVLPFPIGLDLLHDYWIGAMNSVSGGVTLYIDKPLTLHRLHGSNCTGVVPLSRLRQVRIRMHLLWALIRPRMKKCS
jgi:glycosyltransferase involved in cell wall biosynthesis